jgi:hypothetical protein
MLVNFSAAGSRRDTSCERGRLQAGRLNFGDRAFGSGSVAGIIHDVGKAIVGHSHSDNAAD